MNTDQLAEIIVEIKDKKLAKDFLKNLLTEAELEEVVKRVEIVKMLKDGWSQRGIAKKLNVSIGTVSRGARELKYGPNAFNILLK